MVRDGVVEYLSRNSIAEVNTSADDIVQVLI